MYVYCDDTLPVTVPDTEDVSSMALKLVVLFLASADGLRPSRPSTPRSSVRRVPQRPAAHLDDDPQLLAEQQSVADARENGLRLDAMSDAARFGGDGTRDDAASDDDITEQLVDLAAFEACALSEYAQQAVDQYADNPWAHGAFAPVGETDGAIEVLGHVPTDLDGEIMARAAARAVP